jgi:hypothetical protein
MKNQDSLIIERAINKTKEVHLGLCAAMAELEATGVITKEGEAGRRLQESRSGLNILQKILTGEITADPQYGLQKSPR